MPDTTATKLDERVDRFAKEISAIDNAQLIIDELNLQSAEQAQAITGDDLHDAAADAIGPCMSFGARATSVELIQSLGLNDIYECGSVAAALTNRLSSTVRVNFSAYELSTGLRGPRAIAFSGKDAFTVSCGEEWAVAHSTCLIQFLDGLTWNF